MSSDQRPPSHRATGRVFLIHASGRITFTFTFLTTAYVPRNGCAPCHQAGSHPKPLTTHQLSAPCGYHPVPPPHCSTSGQLMAVSPAMYWSRGCSALVAAAMAGMEDESTSLHARRTNPSSRASDGLTASNSSPFPASDTLTASGLSLLLFCLVYLLPCNSPAVILLWGGGRGKDDQVQTRVWEAIMYSASQTASCCNGC